MIPAPRTGRDRNEDNRSTRAKEPPNNVASG